MASATALKDGAFYVFCGLEMCWEVLRDSAERFFEESCSMSVCGLEEKECSTIKG
jgi:hypothetical protein